MKLVVGLGNPGDKYKNTRHNVGFWVVDRLEQENLDEVELYKPQLFMNKSGVEVKEILKKNPKVKPVDLYVIHDDLDIKLGEHKIGEKGPKEHNGLKSIYEQTGLKDFNHVRVGIDNGEFRESGEEYVLSKWKPEEGEVINQVIGKIVEELKDVFA